METPTACPLCQGNTVPTVQRQRLPVLQNVVYATADEARLANDARLDIRVCVACGFAHNAAFDPKTIAYDPSYDNSVPSPIFLQYCQRLAAYLHRKYIPDGGLVLDVGCGNGGFLNVFSSVDMSVRGVGIDPSCNAVSTDRLRFIRDVFRPEYITAVPDLVLCRHTLEHIVQPVEFLRTIRGSLRARVPVFIEVPDATWIVRRAAFWDWCYEHVNYFIGQTASMALALAGIEPVADTPAFGEQYLWVEGITSSDAAAPVLDGVSAFSQALCEYATREADLVMSLRQVLLKTKQSGRRVGVWGMATKGVEFLNLVDREGQLIDLCIDVNPQKQGKYTPATARLIQPPHALQRQEGPWTIVVMNPNYEGEIREQCQSMRVNADFLSV